MSDYFYSLDTLIRDELIRSEGALFGLFWLCCLAYEENQ